VIDSGARLGSGIGGLVGGGGVGSNLARMPCLGRPVTKIRFNATPEALTVIELFAE
jgi:hypothetical protein